jgi:hypothetical protein
LNGLDSFSASKCIGLKILIDILINNSVVIMDEERQVVVLSETVSIGEKILASLRITVTLVDDTSSPERTIRIIDTEEEF